MIFVYFPGRSRSKRHRSEAVDIEERLEKLILKVGDKVCYLGFVFTGSSCICDFLFTVCRAVLNLTGKLLDSLWSPASANVFIRTYGVAILSNLVKIARF